MSVRVDHLRDNERDPNDGVTHSAATTVPNAMFSVGMLVCLRSNPSVVAPVIEVVAANSGERRYRVFQNGVKATYYESQLQALGAKDETRHELSADDFHAYLTSLQVTAPSNANLYSLRSGRVNFVPYQYRPVVKLIRADRPRLLIADEVGVGKTIEAGLILKELRARMDCSSVLIICPKALIIEEKWQQEMLRFDEHFTPLDGRLLRHCLNETHLEGEWPEMYSRAVLPFSLFDRDLVFGSTGRGRKKDRGLLLLDPPPKFDLVIVDEAHHIRNSETFLHQGVRFFCDHAVAVVFLTATPVQMGTNDLFNLLNVLRPDLVIDSASFHQMAEPNGKINAAVKHCRIAKDGWAANARNELEQAAATEWGNRFLRPSPLFEQTCEQLAQPSHDDTARVGLIQSIEELYTFSSFINRTRRRDIGEFTIRKPNTYPVEFTPPQQAVHDGLIEVISRILRERHGDRSVKFMTSTIRRQAASSLYGLVPMLEDILNRNLDKLELLEVTDDELEIDTRVIDEIRAEITDLLENARSLPPYDPKLEAFVGIVNDKQPMPNNKVLVFSTFRHTLRYLAGRLESEPPRIGLVHGNVSYDERVDFRRRFALPKDDPDAIDVLLSSEIASEGLDFQFCDCLVNYDLPWNPMRVEQRIGRLDRYGQKSETVAIVNLITPGTVDAEIYERCLLRIGVFEHSIGGCEEILGEITQQIHAIADNLELTAAERQQRLAQLSDNSIRELRELQELESKQAELFGLSIPNQKWNDELAAADNFWLSPASLQRCITTYLANRLSKDQDYLLGERLPKTLRLNQDFRAKLLEDFKQLPRSAEIAAREWEKWLKGPSPTIAVTFDQETATDLPKSIYLTLSHPLLRQAAAFVNRQEPPVCHLAAATTDVPSGNYQFAIYRWSKVGVKHDEALIAVAEDSTLEARFFELLAVAQTADASASLAAEDFDKLDARHHEKWALAQANHVAMNRQLVEFRKQSLTASHAARRKVLEDQLQRATNDKIQLMKQSELDRAEADFSVRMAELDRAAGTGDIHASPAAFGTIRVE